MANPSFSSVLVGTDGSSTAGTAVTWATALSVKLSAKLVIVSAYETEQSSVSEVLATAAADAEAAGVADVATFARGGDPADAILDVAEEQDCDLIVVGNQGMKGARRFLLGSVPNKVSHHAPCAVLIVRTGDGATAASVTAPISSILVGTNGSATAKRAVEQAIQLAKEFSAKLTVTCVFETRLSPDAPVTPRDAADRVLTSVVDQASAADVTDIETFARDGDPASEILDVAEEQHVDLIVVGNLGMTGTRRRVVGSVPNQISHHAPCSVLVVQTS